MFFAEKGKGSYLNSSRIRVSSNAQSKRALFVLENIELISYFKIQSNRYLNLENIRVMGSCSLDLANTANGKIDCYITDKLKFEKSFAGLFLLQEAGGFIHHVPEFKINIASNNNMIANF